MRTNSICETADVIVYFADKYEKTSSIDKNRKAYYSSIENSVIQNKNLVLEESESKSDDNEDEKYCGVFKSHKEKNE